MGPCRLYCTAQGNWAPEFHLLNSGELDYRLERQTRRTKCYWSDIQWFSKPARCVCIYPCVHACACACVLMRVCIGSIWRNKVTCREHRPDGGRIADMKYLLLKRKWMPRESHCLRGTLNLTCIQCISVNLILSEAFYVNPHKQILGAAWSPGRANSISEAVGGGELSRRPLLKAEDKKLALAHRLISRR